MTKTEDIADLAALKIGFGLIKKFCHSHNECSDACVLYPVCEDLVFKNIGCQCEYALHRRSDLRLRRDPPDLQRGDHPSHAEAL